ncbi:GYF domain containing protein [Histomonas meleagridis]|uniref:GYF domain containing protein n=1 Tax=Histomonas meleagridis TaxID=135588 RepID=UPI00355AAD73|nr:GYF domain containing protein [Histomonas meleagridis]KAH0805404.1 GYF domain containing protein [Histomonas meleagridis]
MNSKFSVLRDDDESNDSDVSSDSGEPNKYLYTIPQILSYYEASKNYPPPPEITHFENVFVSKPQAPECATFTPPKSEINSTIYLNTSGKTSRRTNRPNRNRKGNDSHTEFSQNEPIEEDLQWYYKDPMDHIVGPYSSSTMRNWLLNKRYIDSSLLVKKVSDENFEPISTLFPDINKAFADNKVKPQATNNSINEKSQNTLFAFSLPDAETDLDLDEAGP